MPCEWRKFYPKTIIQEELSTNKSCEKYYSEGLSKNKFIQILSNKGDTVKWPNCIFYNMSRNFEILGNFMLSIM